MCIESISPTHPFLRILKIVCLLEYRLEYSIWYRCIKGERKGGMRKK